MEVENEMSITNVEISYLQLVYRFYGNYFVKFSINNNVQFKFIVQMI